MKPVNYFLTMLVAAVLVTACNNVNYQKAKSGLLYKIISSNKNDSVVKEGQWLKFYYKQKLNDSLLQSNYDKMPVYLQLMSDPRNTYSPVEVFGQLRKGDSLVTVSMVDSLLAKGIVPQLPPNMKKGDRLIFHIKIVEVFRNDSTKQADFAIEDAKDKPRQEKEKEEQMAKYMELQRQQRLKDEQEMETSGEAAKGIAAMEVYLKEKNIPAQKVGKGTYVWIKEQGTGPVADSGKFVTVKYVGRTLDKDSLFDQGTYPLQLGSGEVIAGWDEGLRGLRQGDKGTLYVPGFRAYGKNHPAFRPFAALVFDVELLNVSDTLPAKPEAVDPRRRN